MQWIGLCGGKLEQGGEGMRLFEKTELTKRKKYFLRYDSVGISNCV